MAPQALTTLRELDSREADGLEVRLLWHPEDGRVAVAVADPKTGEWRGIDAFAHTPAGRRLAWAWGGIWVARADGTQARRIATDRMGQRGAFSFSSYAPSWQPFPPFGG